MKKVLYFMHALLHFCNLCTSFSGNLIKASEIQNFLVMHQPWRCLVELFEARLVKLGSLVHKSLCSSKQVQENIVHLATLHNTHVCLIVYLIVHQMKYIIER